METPSFFFYNFHMFEGDASVYLSSQFSFVTLSHHTRSQTFNTLIVPSLKNNSGGKKKHFITGQASYGIIYQITYVITFA